MINLLFLVFLLTIGPAREIRSEGFEGEGQITVLHHDLSVELFPATHRIEAVDLVRLMVTGDEVQVISLYLNKELRIEAVLHAGKALPFTLHDPSLPEEEERFYHIHYQNYKKTRLIRIPLFRKMKKGEEFSLQFTYSGEIYDPVQGSSRLARSGAPTETSGLIGEEGIYLSEETRWYPDLPASLASYTVSVRTPAGWEVVTQGERLTRSEGGKKVLTIWESKFAAESLPLIGGPFVISQKKFGGVEISTYLFQEDAHLSDEYTEAAARYIEFYSKLLGPYPFSKFTVVENFFPTGLGFPSFTLLGSGIIKRRYIQPFALGHEIVHCWWGNFVLNDFSEGNWVEGLTTYLANYYYDEATEKPEKATDHRRRMILEYSTYISEERDYPLGRFLLKTDPKDNAIGYSKAAMIFHMLRQEIGDEAFFRTLRSVVSTEGGRRLTWVDLQAAFEETSGKELSWFFRQWVHERGAPLLSVRKARWQKEERGYRVSALLAQKTGPFRLSLPVVVETAGERKIRRVDLHAREQKVEFHVNQEPRFLLIDPEYQVFRRLPPEEMPSILNILMGDPTKLVVVPTGGSERERGIYQEIAERIEKAEGAVIKSDQVVTREDLERHPVFLLGGEGVNAVFPLIQGKLPDGLEIGREGFVIGGKRFGAPESALLLSVRNPYNTEKVMTLFLGLSEEAISRIAPLLFFYGWESYLVFQSGRVVDRGDFPPPAHPMTVSLEEE